MGKKSIDIDEKTKGALLRLKEILNLKSYNETLIHLLKREGLELEDLNTKKWNNHRTKVRNLLEDKTNNLFNSLGLDKRTKTRVTEEYLNYINQFRQYGNLLKKFQKGDILELLESLPDIVNILSKKVIDYEIKLQNIATQVKL